MISLKCICASDKPLHVHASAISWRKYPWPWVHATVHTPETPTSRRLPLPYAELAINRSQMQVRQWLVNDGRGLQLCNDALLPVDKCMFA